jgi:arginase
MFDFKVYLLLLDGIPFSSKKKTTFGRLEKQPMNKEIAFLINRSEITAGTRGASQGPGAIMTAARNNKKFFFGEFPSEELEDVNHLLDQPTSHAFAKRIDGLVRVYESLTAKIANQLKAGKFPVVLAADHGSAGGTIAGIKAAFPKSRLGVVWIDAHADLHTPYTTPSGNLHGMPLSTALNEDNLESKINDVPADTIVLWNQLKHVGGIAPKIFPEDLIFIGVRDTEDQENSIIKSLKIKNFQVSEVNDKGPEAVVSEIEMILRHCDLIYVSFDVDSMDPNLTSHGTGTPVKNGLTPTEAKALLTGFAKNSKTVCMEFVEVNPCLDEKINKMAEVAADLVEAVLTNLA